jgi:ubiquitin C-terminal hydrolase
MEIIMTYFNNENNSIKPSLFIENFKKHHKKFNNKSHQDSQEFLRLLLDDLSLELNRNISNPEYIEIIHTGKSKSELNQEYYNMFLKREDSLIVDLFHGQICNTFSCSSCNFPSYSFEKFMDIPLIISQNYLIKCNSSDLIDDFFKEETIDWDNFCINCKKKAKHKKLARISRLPKILIITFQRYNLRTNSKNLITISFKDSLALNKYIDKDCVAEKDSKYALSAISNHAGKINFGHYYA